MQSSMPVTPSAIHVDALLGTCSHAQSQRMITMHLQGTSHVRMTSNLSTAKLCLVVKTDRDGQ